VICQENIPPFNTIVIGQAQRIETFAGYSVLFKYFNRKNIFPGLNRHGRIFT